jgi:hypothetical protein
MGESLSGDCLILTVLALPQLTAALLAEARTLRRESYGKLGTYSAAGRRYPDVST